MDTVGEIRSPADTLFTVTVTELEAVLPAASLAITFKVCEPFATVPEFQELVKGEVLLVFAGVVPASMYNFTEATPTLSVAVTVTLIVPETDAPLAGDVKLTTGLVRSLPLDKDVDPEDAEPLLPFAKKSADIIT